MKNITASNLNKALSRIQEAGFEPFTDLKLIQQENTRLIRPHGRKQSGRIMSYNESVNYQKSMQIKNPNIKIWSKQEYQMALNKLYEENAASFTVTGAKTDFYTRALDVLNRAGVEISANDLKSLSIDEVRDIFESANEATTYGDSGLFYKTLKTSLGQYEKDHKRLEGKELYEMTMDRFKELSTKKE